MRFPITWTAVLALALASLPASGAIGLNGDVLVDLPDEGPVPLRRLASAPPAPEAYEVLIERMPDGPVPLGGGVIWSSDFPLRRRRGRYPPGGEDEAFDRLLEKTDPAYWRQQTAGLPGVEADVVGGVLGYTARLVRFVARLPRDDRWAARRLRALKALKRLENVDGATAALRRRWHDYEAGRPKVDGGLAEALAVGTVARVHRDPPWAWARFAIPAAGDLPQTTALLVGPASGPCRLRPGRLLVGGLLAGRWNPEADSNPRPTREIGTTEGRKWVYTPETLRDWAEHSVPALLVVLCAPR